MKRIVFIFLITLFGLNAQSFLVTNISNNSTITPNSTITVNTSPNANIKVTFDVKNTSSQTKNYIAKRYDILLNAGANAYFCFAGNCYGPSTMVSPQALTLTAGTSASQLQGQYNMLTADLDEGPAAGQSIIRYTIQNENQASDSLQFTIHYNAPSSVTENAINRNFKIYPTIFSQSFYIKSKHEYSAAKIELYDITGQKVFSQYHDFSNSNDVLQVNTGNLASGVYLIKITQNQRVLTKRIIKE
ncbi:MAG: T9SS type A sorting domain-containing protein [Bacteroidia bacterium]|nr:T9SS type A sorting domain-containing protein [Bacteroidia bacterium]